MSEQSEKRSVIQQVSEQDLSAMLLGENDVLLGFQSRDELNQLIAILIEQGKSEVRYFSNKFDHQVVGYSPVPDAIQRFLMNNHESRLKTLVSSSQELVQSGSRLVELLRANMPRVECRTRRQGNSGHESFSGSFVLIDNHGYVYLPDPDRFIGTACFNAAGTVDKFSEVFEESWHVADTDPEMQRLYI